jgi:hypothetical protein
VVIGVEGDVLDVASLDVRAEGEDPIVDLGEPRVLAGGDAPVDLAFPPLESGVASVRIRKARSNEGVARISLMCGDQTVRGIALTDNHEIAKTVQGLDGSHTLGVVAAEGLWFHGPWEFLFYDEDLNPLPPEAEATSFYFRDLGLVKMRDRLDSDGVHISFASGPEISKEQGDKNAFTLRAFGENLAMPLRTPRTGEDRLTQAQYDLTAWYEGTSGRNTILVDGRGQPTVHEESPVPKEYDRQWLGQEGIPKSGKIEEAYLSPDYDYVRGEAAHAYRPLLDTYRRHLMFVKPVDEPGLRYIILFDAIVAAAGRPAEIEWRLLTPCDDLSATDGMTRIRGTKTRLEVTHLLPDASGVAVDMTPAARERDRRAFARFPTQGRVEAVQYLHVLQPVQLTSPDPSLRSERVDGTNGVGVRVTELDRTVLAVFRAGGELVSAAGLRTDAFACLLVVGADGKAQLTVHDGTFAEWEGKRVFEAVERSSGVVQVD